jgi:predicted amidohydrolase
MQDLKVSAIQSALVWENPDANLKAFGERISDIQSSPDLIVLPEMFSTGFSMNSAALAEKMDGKSISWMAEQASS